MPSAVSEANGTSAVKYGPAVPSMSPTLKVSTVS